MNRKLFSSGLALTLILTGSMASAQAAGGSADDLNDLAQGIGMMREQMEYISDMAAPRCVSQYNELYSSPELKVSLFSGYENFDNITTDATSHKTMVKALTSKCLPHTAACEFKVTKRERNHTQLEKSISGKRILVDVYSTSLMNDDNANLYTTQYYKQEAESQKVREQFYRDLVHKDVVFYSGHSRLGAGLGFNAQTWFQEGVNALFRQPLMPILKALETRPSRLKMLGLFACSTDMYYRQHIDKANDNISLILTGDEVDFYEAPQAELGALDSILTKRCVPGFQAAMITTSAPDHPVTKLIGPARLRRGR